MTGPGVRRHSGAGAGAGAWADDGVGGDAVVVAVAGGTGGLAASYASVRALADDFDEVGDRMRGAATVVRATIGDPDLIASGLLSPLSCAAAEAALVVAATGPRGLLPGSLGLEADAIAIRCAVRLLESVDDVVHQRIHELDVLLAHTALGPAALAVGLVSGSPGLIEPVLDGLTTPGVRAALAAAYGSSGRPTVTPYGATTASGQVRPGSVHDLIAHLQEVAALSPDPDSRGNGTIQVQTIRGVDGVRHVVYLPGTDHFEAPWDRGADVRDMGTNLALMAGTPDAYTQGIREAMQQAGIGSEEPVCLVGHSQGGMAAVSLLAGAGGAGFQITNVVTAGSPTEQVGGRPAGWPDGAQVLSLEQRGDLVPLLDGAPNSDTIEQTTLTFDAHPSWGVVDHHSYPTYLQGAALADASSDPSVSDSVTDLHAQGFLGADDGGVSSQVFQIQLVP